MLEQSGHASRAEVTSRARSRVNTRTPAIAGGNYVKLEATRRRIARCSTGMRSSRWSSTDRVRERRRWRFPGKVPLPLPVIDGFDEPLKPWNGWGQMLPRLLPNPARHHEPPQSGESIKSSLGAKRFDKVFAEMKPGDWLLLRIRPPTT